MILKPLSEQDKSQIAQKRNQSAFKAYFIDNYKVFEKYAFSFLHDRHLAEDVASEVLWKMWHLGPDLMHVSSPERYLLRSVKNRCLNLLRVKHVVYESNEDLHDLLTDEIDPEKLMISKEAVLKIETAVAALPEKTKQAFKLVKEQEYSYKQAAQIMNISTNTVDRHVQIALQRLWQALKKKR